ncbi:MAG: hypothetical protein N3E41_04635 [Thermofilaceae archaeon]|nr:hypothetical protein [Thermofilaceae archaeon]MDW8003753.1 Rpp14/Pop5 family protein [Thermofilaceae archaeon]
MARTFVDEDQLKVKLIAAVMELAGIKGLAETGPVVVYSDPTKKIVVIRVRRNGLVLFKASLAMYRDPIVTILKVTGTLRKAIRLANSLEPEGS